MKQLSLIERGAAEKTKVPLPLEGTLREQLVGLLAAAFVAVHQGKGESSDDRASVSSQDHARTPGP